MDDEKFGGCCDDLRSAMQDPPESFIRVEDNGVLYLTVGYAKTEQGIGWFDSALMFCPFCGTELQTAAQVRASAGEPVD